MRFLSRRVTIIAATAAFAIGVPLGVAFAGATFSDVPPSNPFYNDISALANSGVTGGCGGGKFCPKDNVTREQMAAFMNRLGALSPSKTPVVNADKVDGYDSTDLLPGGTLPAGRTLVGSFHVMDYDTNYYADTISFGYRLLAPPTVHYISSGDSVPSGCSGSASNPGASPGHLCVFEAQSSNISHYDCIWSPITFACSSASREGFGITQNGASAAQFYAFGTWAVTGGAAVSGGADVSAGDGRSAFGS